MLNVKRRNSNAQSQEAEPATEDVTDVDFEGEINFIYK